MKSQRQTYVAAFNKPAQHLISIGIFCSFNATHFLLLSSSFTSPVCIYAISARYEYVCEHGTMGKTHKNNTEREKGLKLVAIIPSRALVTCLPFVVWILSYLFLVLSFNNSAPENHLLLLFSQRLVNNRE